MPPSTVIFTPHQSSQEGSPWFQLNICSIRQPLMTHPHEKVYLCSDVILQRKTNRTGSDAQHLVGAALSQELQ